MAVPKRKMSRSNTRSRRSQWKAVAPTLVTCPNRACGEKKLPHVVCPSCGTYKGRQVIAV
ncbi:MAG: 50S ribosomal protein L32 [Nocardiaceae bacterium]|nr:50S ribosomal protein L32 [Nocardiaceae bacterium]